MDADRKMTGLLLGAHDGIEKALLSHFCSCGYELQFAGTLAVAEDCIRASDYDVIFCFEKFIDGQTTFDFVSSLDESNNARVVALLDKEGIKEYRRRKCSGVSHFFHVETNLALIQFFVDQIAGEHRFLRVAACPN